MLNKIEAALVTERGYRRVGTQCLGIPDSSPGGFARCLTRHVEAKSSRGCFMGAGNRPLQFAFRRDAEPGLLSVLPPNDPFSGVPK